MGNLRRHQPSDRWLHDAEPLPARPILLTFDDGYADHFTYVRPALLERGARAVFFLPGQAVVERVPLDANLIQFVIASAPSTAVLEAEVEDGLREAGLDEPHLRRLRRDHRHPGQFDDARTAYVKRLLQFALPGSVRAPLLAALFHRYVSHDEMAFADDLYLTLDQAEGLLDDGFHLGGHGWSHRRLSQMTRAEIEEDLGRSLALLDQLDPFLGRVAFCYPYGDHSDDSAACLRRHDVRTAYTVESRILRRDDMPLGLPRLDTNDVPGTTASDVLEVDSPAGP